MNCDARGPQGLISELCLPGVSENRAPSNLERVHLGDHPDHCRPGQMDSSLAMIT